MLCLAKLSGLGLVRLSRPSGRIGAFARAMSVMLPTDISPSLLSGYGQRHGVSDPLLITLCCDLVALLPHVSGWCSKFCHFSVSFCLKLIAAVTAGASHRRTERGPQHKQPTPIIVSLRTQHAGRWYRLRDRTQPV